MIKKKPIKICLLSTGPGKTLGDAALCKTLAKHLIENYNVEVETKLYLINEDNKQNVINKLKPLDSEFPGKHSFDVQSGNLDFNHEGFNPEKYDLIIPFAAYNLFTEDFRLKTQFLKDKPKVALYNKDGNINDIITNLNLDQQIVILKNHDKFYAAFKNKKQRIETIELSNSDLLNRYFEHLAKDKLHTYDDYFHGPDFEVLEDSQVNACKIKSKATDHLSRENKAKIFKDANDFQNIVLEVAEKQLGKVPKDKCVYLSRYDYFFNDYLGKMPGNSLEFLGIEPRDIPQYGDIFNNSKIQNIQSGLGSNCHGILMPPKKEQTKHLDNLAKIKQSTDESDNALIEAIFSGKSFDAYKKNHELFFGYHNIIPNTDISALPIKGFVKTCIATTDKQNVDFVLNVCPDNSDSSTTCKISEVVKGIDLSKYNVVYINKNKDKQLEVCEKFGDFSSNKPLIRIINPFPVKPKTMNTMFNISHPITLQTGNSSIIEAYDNNKVPLYQLTSWSDSWLDSLEAKVKSTLGDDSKYYQIFKIANDANTTEDFKAENISRIYRANKEIIAKEVQQFSSALANDKASNLKENLPKLFDNFGTKLEPKRKNCKKDRSSLVHNYFNKSMNLIHQLRVNVSNYLDVLFNINIAGSTFTKLPPIPAVSIRTEVAVGTANICKLNIEIGAENNQVSFGK